MLDFQLKQLKLNERHPDAINIFLFSLKPALQFFRGLAEVNSSGGESRKIGNILTVVYVGFCDSPRRVLGG